MIGPDLPEQAMRLGAGTILGIEAIRPILFAYGLVVVLRFDAVVRPDLLGLRLGLMPAWLAKNVRHVGAGGGIIVHGPSVDGSSCV
jgi:hypothetical protein